MTSTVSITIVRMQCGTCGVFYGVEREWLDNRQNEGGDIHCPNGCRRTYGETEKSRLREKLKRAEDHCINLRARNDQLRAECDAQERKTRAEKAAKTRIKNRVGNGVCPCCKRQFQNLKRHMQSKHPDYQAVEG